MADISQIALPDGSIYDVKDNKSISSVSVNKNVLILTFRNGTTKTITLGSVSAFTYTALSTTDDINPTT